MLREETRKYVHGWVSKAAVSRKNLGSLLTASSPLSRGARKEMRSQANHRPAATADDARGEVAEK